MRTPARLTALTPLLFLCIATAARPLLAGLDEQGILAMASVDRMHARLSNRVDETADWIDGFFGTERVDDEAATSLVRLRSTLEYAEGGSLDLSLRARAKLVLPNLRNRLQIVFGTEDDDAVTHDLDAVNSLPHLVDEARETEYSSALRFIIAESRQWNSYVSGGVRYHSSPDPYVRLRTRRVIDVDPALLRLSQRFTRYKDIGFESRSTVSLEGTGNNVDLLRAASEVTWREDRHGVEWTQSAHLARELDSFRAVAFQASMTSLTRPSAVVDRYEADVRYRRRLRGNWCYGEIEPRMTFPNERDFRFTPSLVFALEVVLGSP